MYPCPCQTPFTQPIIMAHFNFEVFFMKISFFSTVLASLICSASHAYYTVQESGELLKPEQMQAATEIQFITSGDEGINVIGRFDKGFDEESNLRFVAGAGTTDFFIAGYLKWVPFPDFEKQPAIGFSFGAQYGHYESDNELALRVVPFTSKKFDTDKGEFSPYAALPFAFSNYDEDSTIPFQLALGSRYRHHDFDHFDFNAELGFDINNAFAYVSLGAIFPAFE